jgi:hypothetical protein
MKMGRTLLALLAAAALACPAQAAEVLLKRKFVEVNRNRATLRVGFILDHAKSSPNAIADDGKDGDLHMAGRASKVGLPMVAELVNARMEPQALQYIKQQAGQTAEGPLEGVWRLWFEHPSAGLQVQQPTVPKPSSTNPDHVFEIHPITRIGTFNVLGSLQPIPGFTAYDAEKAFEHYEDLKVTVQRIKGGVVLKSPKAKFNYAQFTVRFKGKPKKYDDCRIVLADVLDNEGHSIVAGPRRMVFVDGANYAIDWTTAKAGDEHRLLGIPRVNLAEVYALLQTLKIGEAKPLAAPYEMIVVAKLPNSP